MVKGIIYISTIILLIGTAGSYELDTITDIQFFIRFLAIILISCILCNVNVTKFNL